MKVLLVNPYFSKYRGDDAFPLGIGYIATSLLRSGIDVSVLDCHILKMEMPQMIDYISNEKPDVVGFTVMTPTFQLLKNIISSLREYYNPIIIGGGPHATFRPEELLSAGFDIAIRGEGEQTTVEVVKAIENGDRLEKISGISFISKGRIIHTSDRELERNIDLFSFPERRLFPYKKYKIMSLVTSRGCPYKCIYCAATQFWGEHVRFRSISNVMDELKDIKELGFKKIRFEDSTFTINHEHVRSICNVMKEEGLDFRWSCETRPDTINKNILVEMQKAGCVLLCIGVDSGNQKILDSAQRKVKVETIEKAFRTAHEVGIRTRAYVVFGLPGENADTVQETIKLLEKIKPDQIMLSLATIYPGTPLEQYSKSSFRLSESWVSQFGGHGIGANLFLSEELTIDEYKNLAELLLSHIKKLR